MATASAIIRGSLNTVLTPLDLPDSKLVLAALEIATRRGRPGHKDESVPSGSHAASGRLPGKPFQVDVEGVGALRFPLPADQVESLSAAAKPSPYGLREKTLVDPKVRSSVEIDGDRLRLQWDETALNELLDEVASALGLPSIALHPHKLLVYGPGQFFKPHQDTEKRPGMVGTLVVVLPCAHIGGTLRIEHGEEAFRFESQQLGSAGDIRWCAFYADCRHEVEPVTEGWRVALTFDLVVPESASTSAPPADPTLVSALRALFLRPDAPRTEPWALLLDHDYSEHGLYWPLLKGKDRARAEVLRAAAESLGLQVLLALFEEHSVWNAEYQGPDDSPVPGSLIDEELRLDFWRGLDGKVLSRKSVMLRPDDVASFTETGDDHLVDEEFEGYMGNYGETLEYWYRRAAIVVQSPGAAARTRFRLDIEGALADLRRMAGDPAHADAVAQTLAVTRDLSLAAIRAQGRELLAPVVGLLIHAANDDLAMELMAAFKPEEFLPDDADVLAALAKARGESWMLGLLNRWAEEWHRRAGSLPRGYGPGDAATASPWTRHVDQFLPRATAAGLTARIVEAWLELQFSALIRFDQSLAEQSPAARKAWRPTHLAMIDELARAFAAQPSGAAADALAGHLRKRPTLYPPEELVPIVLALAPAAGHPGVEGLRADVASALRARLAQPERSTDDHSLREVEWTCRCALCSPVIQWAESRTAEPLLTPLAEARRRHIIDALDKAGAPISHDTIKRGSPYILALYKPSNLLDVDRQRRSRWREALARLG